MLEEIAMEKKSSIRTGQGPSKGICSESKKNQDTTNGKPFPRSSRKREPPNSNGSKYDQNRKPLPQKSKAFDKRPKPRGLGFDSSGRKENCQVTDLDLQFGVEYGYLEGSKKQSLNHLLNFHYEPRGENMPKKAQQSAQGCSTKSLMATQAHKYNKEQFLQANCQFVVREGEDYTFYLGDPDLLVDWGHVELIVTSSSEKVVCPICLYAPVAGKITRCGHVYCWPCVLHYLALSDKSWRKCPICYESIHKNDLRSVVCVEKTQYSVGQEITMRLMKRERGSLVLSPVNQFSTRTNKPILSYGETEIDTVYSKLLTASLNIVMDILSRESSELQTLVEEFSGCPELCFVEQAIDLLAERRSLLTSPKTGNEAVSLSSSPNDSSTNLKDPNEGFQQSNQRSEIEIPGSEGDEVTNISAEDLEIKTSNQAQKHFFFYQAVDGQHIYLHSLNVRMLEMMYGSLDNCPMEISGKIVEKEPGSMTSQLRKRLRYLQHVPITCQFEVVELDLRPPTISEETLNNFKDQVEDRHRRRLRQAKAEKKRERKIEEAEMLQFNRRPAPNLSLESHFHFPQFGLEETNRTTSEKLPTENVTSGNSSRSGSPRNFTRDKSPLSLAVAALSLDSEDQGPSFAKMLREGKTITQETWPTIGSGCSNSSGGGGGGGWGRRTRQISITHEDSDNETAFSPPAKPSFNIAEAIQLAASIERGETSTVSGRKKKKKQQKILFSTGIPKGN